MRIQCVDIQYHYQSLTWQEFYHINFLTLGIPKEKPTYAKLNNSTQLMYRICMAYDRFILSPLSFRETLTGGLMGA